jgi:uncharacterized membrane protein (DUF485 family)
MPPYAPPAPPDEHRDPAVERYNARLGLVLFAVYCLGYGAFVLVNAFAPKVMDAPVGRLNAAVAWGLALIGGAVVLSLVYAVLCKSPTRAGQNGGRS